MIITELAARKKICPMRASSNCSGGDCMMWRYATKEQVIHGAAENCAYEDGNSASEHVEFYRNEFNEGNFAESFHGYCGLAGIPIMKG